MIICQNGPAVKGMPVDPRVFLWLYIQIGYASVQKWTYQESFSIEEGFMNRLSTSVSCILLIGTSSGDNVV